MGVSKFRNAAVILLLAAVAAVCTSHAQTAAPCDAYPAPGDDLTQCDAQYLCVDLGKGGIVCFPAMAPTLDAVVLRRTKRVAPQVNRVAVARRQRHGFRGAAGTTGGRRPRILRF